MELIVHEYSFTLSSQPEEEQSPVAVPAPQVERLLHEPVVADDGDRIVSIRDQLSIWIRPPLLTLVDHSGAAPAREVMVDTAAAAILLLANHGLDHDIYGWDVEGKVVGTNPDRSLRGLSNHRHITDNLGEAAESWSIRQVDFGIRSGPGLSAYAPISLQLKIEHSEEGEEELMFAASDHHHRPPDAEALLDDAARMWVAASDLIGRLAT